MLFKIFYCDDAATANYIFNEYQTAGYDTDIYDRAGCATFDIVQNERNYVDSQLIIKNRHGKEQYKEQLSYWRNYIIVFEDNTVINLFRNFNSHVDSKQNREMLTNFINAVRETFNRQNVIIIQDDDEDFVV